MSNVHSVKLPTQLRTAIKITRKVIEEQQSLKTLLFNERHARIGRLNALLDNVFRNKTLIENIIKKSEILEKEPRLDKYVCLVLVTELLLGHGNLKGDAKPIQTVLAYKNTLQEIYDQEGADRQIKHDPLPRYVRVNTLKIKLKDALKEILDEGFFNVTRDFETYNEFIEAVKELNEFDFLLDYHIPNLLVFSPKTRSYWATSQFVLENKFILQDKASCFPPVLLEPKKKSCILDMCAAPGMKTSQLAAIIKNQGKIYANDMDTKRYEAMCSSLKEKNVKCVKFLNRDAMELNGEDYPDVEYILVDPSCSSSGMSSIQTIGEKDNLRIRKLARLQTMLLVHTLQKFPYAKRVVYSTCSIYEEENEQVVEKALQRCPAFKLLDGRDFVGESWLNFGSSHYKDVGDKCLYLRETNDLTNGFFCAVFENKNLNNSEHDNEEINSTSNGNYEDIDDLKIVNKKRKLE